MSDDPNENDAVSAQTSSDAPVDAPGDVRKMIEQALALRNMLTAIEADAAERSKPLVDALNKLRTRLLAYMSEHNIQSLRTKSGTAYSTVRKRAVLQDVEAFMAWVQRTGATDMLDISVNANAAWDYADEHKVVPDGVALSAFPTVNFRSR